MVGDRANTDILLGKNCGLQTLLVGTGCHTLKDVEEWQKSDNSRQQHNLVPHFYVPRFEDLTMLMQKAGLPGLTATAGCLTFMLFQHFLAQTNSGRRHFH